VTTTDVYCASDGQLLLGDCLVVLPEAISSPTFQLVYVDPPYNTGLSHGARGASGARKDGQVAYVDAWGGLDGFLTMLEPRLASWRDALLPEGSLWLHLDHRTVHDAKVLADRVFGRSGYRGEVIWVPGNGGRGRSGPPLTHQSILIYASARDFIYNTDDPSLREPYAPTSQRMHFRSKDADGRAYRERHIGNRTYRYYADRGRRLGSVWTDCPAMRANTPLLTEATGYPTQKPRLLLDRIVRAASLEGGSVLDPMCGSGTTLVAARELHRKWLGIDQSPVAINVAHTRLTQLPLVPVDSRARVG
jgi:site-specific DNA-methyltransferase (adenine-specific)